MSQMINEINEVECEVLVQKFEGLGLSQNKIGERLKMLDEKCFFYYNFPLRLD